MHSKAFPFYPGLDTNNSSDRAVEKPPKGLLLRLQRTVETARPVRSTAQGSPLTLKMELCSPTPCLVERLSTGSGERLCYQSHVGRGKGRLERTN